MPTIQPVGASSKVNFLLHTDIGWGKTSLIGSGGNDFKILIMSPPTDHRDPIVGSGCSEMIVKSWEDIWEGLDYIRSNGPDWDFFCMDSISLLQDVGLDDVYEGTLDRQGPPGSAKRQYREQFGPDKGEYRVNMWRLGQWIRKTVGEGAVNLIITAHSFYWEPEEGSGHIAPWVQGKNMPSKICGMMNLVGYGDMREVSVRGNRRQTRVIHWDKTSEYYAKCQFKDPSTGQSVFPTGASINPTLPQIMEAINRGRASARGTRRPSNRPSHNMRPAQRAVAAMSGRAVPAVSGRPSQRS